VERRLGSSRAATDRENRNGQHRFVTSPHSGEIDMFAVYCPANDQVYAVPVTDAPLTDCSLRLDPTRNGQADGVRWAAEYELPA
jgi:hypothetical protein